MIANLVHLATAEYQCWQARQPATTHHTMALFRLAIVERNQEAWSAIYTLYIAQVVAWVLRSRSYPLQDENADILAVDAFGRFWHAVTPERFVTFPSLAALLAYLRLCATSEVIDRVRISPPATCNLTMHQASPDVLTPRIGGMAVWNEVRAVIQSRDEAIAIYELFVEQRPPRVIQHRNPDVFPNVHAVYVTRRRILQRLSYHKPLQQIWIDL